MAGSGVGNGCSGYREKGKMGQGVAWSREAPQRRRGRMAYRGWRIDDDRHFSWQRRGGTKILTTRGVPGNEELRGARGRLSEPMLGHG
jgi:hypothetical protein